MKIDAREIIALLLFGGGLALVFLTSGKPLTVLGFALMIAGGAVISTGRKSNSE